MLFTLQRYEFFSKSQQVSTMRTTWNGCCLPYKGTNFLANHNGTGDISDGVPMLFTLQRYEFFSKSQQTCPTSRTRMGCCLPYKGTNFLANHNGTACRVTSQAMLFTLQRYEFFSKSQHMHSLPLVLLRCCLPYKGTNFLANHNKAAFSASVKPMLFTLQRYEFFSKSQL